MMASETFHIVILGHDFGFPHGRAATNRVLLLARGLLQAGATVSVLHTGATEIKGQEINTQTQGLYKGIYFEYTTGTVYRRDTQWLRRWFKGRREVSGILGAVRVLRRLKSAGQINGIILYSRSFPFVLIFGILAKQYGIPVVLELCEWPLAIPARSPFKWLKNFLFCRYSFHFVDGVLPISQFLEKRARDFIFRTRKNLAIVHVPVLVDLEEFHLPQVLPNRYMLFCGAPYYVDIIDYVIQTYRESGLAEEDVELVLVGITGNERGRRWRKLRENIVRSQLHQKIRFTGYVSRAELLGLYSNASALLIPLPDDDQSRARFPTKIGEYLASGRPVVTTAVGESLKYLKHGESALIARPGDRKDYARQLVYAYQHREHAFIIGLNGRKVAERYFDYKVHGKRVLQMLLSLSDRMR